MAELYQSVMADNGGYFLSAYGIVFGTLIGYALWLRSRLSALTGERRLAPGERDG